MLSRVKPSNQFSDCTCCERKIGLLLIEKFRRYFNPQFCGTFKLHQVRYEVSRMQRRKTICQSLIHHAIYGKSHQIETRKYLDCRSSVIQPRFPRREHSKKDIYKKRPRKLWGAFLFVSIVKNQTISPLITYRKNGNNFWDSNSKQ